MENGLKRSVLVIVCAFLAIGVAAVCAEAQVFTATSQPTDIRLILEGGEKVDYGLHARGCFGCREHNRHQVVLGAYGNMEEDRHGANIQYALHALNESLWISPRIAVVEGEKPRHSVAATIIPGPFQANIEVLDPLEGQETVLSAGYYVDDTVYIVPGMSYVGEGREEFIAFRWPFTDNLWLQGRWDTDADRVLLQVFGHGNF